MKRLSAGLIRLLQYVSIVTLVAVVLLSVMMIGNVPTAHALPEYASRTGEGCATCHVSPGGGGPRTLRGLLWGARGKPDKVPTLPGVLIAPYVNDGAELYDIACAACHGKKAEGLFAIGLVGIDISKVSVRSFIERGITRSGMPSFQGQFTDDQLSALVDFVTGLSNGSVKPLPDSYPLSPARFKCDPLKQSTGCGDY
ncbi:MAG: cytochrome c [Chloroflexi bacterium]|nr:cytochrome c [Chloroflexota bacterium]